MKNSQSTPAFLTVIDVIKWYAQAGQRLRVLDEIQATFEQGISYAITGASGSGKSTLLHILGGIDEPSSGHVLYGEHDLAKLSTRQRASVLRHKVGFVFQFHYLIRELTVLENIMLPGQIVGMSRADTRARGLEILERVGLSAKETSLVTQLSGGEQQRVAIARALFNKPWFLFADEPTGNLDAVNAQLIVDLIKDCQKEWKMGVVLCTHDQEVARRMEERYHLEKGRLIV